MDQHLSPTAEYLPIIKVQEDQHLVAGWLYVMQNADGSQVVDVSGDYVDDVEELQKAAHDFVTDSRNGDVMHDGKIVATMVESLVTEPDRMRAMGVPDGILPVGWYGVWSIQDDAVWQRIKKGDLRAFSVAGTGSRIPVEAI